MQTYKIINLVTLHECKVPAMTPDMALAIAREHGFTAMFYSVEAEQHNRNRWNVNRGIVA